MVPDSTQTWGRVEGRDKVLWLYSFVDVEQEKGGKNDDSLGRQRRVKVQDKWALTVSVEWFAEYATELTTKWYNNALAALATAAGD